jgi:ribosomal protein L11 methyltransferase
VSVRVEPGKHREAAMAALFGAGAQGVHEDGPALVTHFPASADLASMRRALAAAAPGATIAVEPTPDVNWAEAWKARLGAHDLGRLTIAPPWLAAEHDPATTIIVDPGMAFGTGDHPTTRGVVRLMQGVVRPGAVVADLGAGSAVLAIAAAKLGAVRVAAIEIDPDAIGNALENVERNGVTGIVHVLEGDAGALLPLVRPVDVVLANIISSVLLELLPAIGESLAPGGAAILSGILREERDTMLEALAAAGWRATAEDVEDVWWSVAIDRP